MIENSQTNNLSDESYCSFNQVTEKYDLESQGIENDLSKISLCAFKARNDRDKPNVFNLTKDENDDYQKRIKVFFLMIAKDKSLLSEKDKQFLYDRERHLNKLYLNFFVGFMSAQVTIHYLLRRIAFEKRPIYFRSFMIFSITYITISHYLACYCRSNLSDKLYSDKIYHLINNYV